MTELNRSKYDPDPGEPHIFTINLSTRESERVDSKKNAYEAVDDQPRDFEEAIEATGFGRFNYLLLLAILPGRWTTVFDTTSMSYVIPSAECDLEMDLYRKGLLNAVIYAGMISSGFLWGFLADTRGRKSLLLLGYIGDATCNIIGSTSQTFWMLLTFKFISGFIVNGPFAINVTYLAEFQTSNNRSKAMMWIGLFIASGNFVIPALAWSIIPRSWSIVLFDGAFVYNSWRIFLLACSVPSIIAFVALLYFPESPKFLMSQGRNDEALEVFRRIYAMNTGKSPESFPIRVLRREGGKNGIEERSTNNGLALSRDNVRNGWNQIKPLFDKPYLRPLLIIVVVQFCAILGMNTLRLWLPQLFAMMENFDYEDRDPNLPPPTLCEMINVGTNASRIEIIDDFNSTVTSICIPAIVRDKVYINSIIIATTGMTGYLLAERTINLIGKKTLLLTALALPAMCTFAFNWSPNADVTLTLASVYIALTSISTTTVISFVVDLMPTSLRTFSIGLTMSVGRCGAILGNILFPIFLTMGCLTPFMALGGFLTISFILTIFIPNPTGILL